jgi:hypothetical protein
MRLRDKPAPSTGEAKPEGRGDEMGSETQVTKRGDEMVRTQVTKRGDEIIRSWGRVRPHNKT